MNLISLIHKLTKAVLFALFALSLSMTAQAKSNVNTTELSYEPELEHQRDPNQYCAKCHKFDKADEQTVVGSGGQFHFGKFHGAHLEKKNPNNGKAITCVNCHGNISEDHRRGAKDVMRFEGDIFGDKKPMYSAQEQNQVCFSCHQPEKLREKLWAHDVHAMKLPCASCHTLHPKEEPMKGIQPKQRVKLCVDCHGEQQKRNNQKSENQKQEDKK
ncbi:cytochrome c nitrite reductase pentaheme subunit [Rodentibacter caecimuris]|uniref:Cytochrome c nitrite reductase pentaheme subunit n=1 Tax=Rodentibacter caecimuris TaxID=1796644 RepID=A0ABX3KXS5_9PAST|nr:cytochrome c nitrite reductase pentaheme subunit [Rodentibacter heylii]